MGLFNTTPVYAGDGQPPSDDKGNGVLGMVTGIFSFSSTPSYQSAAPVVAPTTPTTPTTPAASSSSTTATSSTPPADDSTACAAIPIVVMPDCNGQYPAAVVIERSK